MLEIASKIVICLLIAAVIGFIIGYLVAKSSSKKTSTIPTEEIVEKNETEEVIIPTKNVVADAVKALKEVDSEKNLDDEEIEEAGIKPELLTAAREGKKDKLTKIKGIGTKVEEQLNKAGIYHFDQIANWTDENIKWLEINTTFAHRAKKDLCVIQSKSFT
jgi:NADH-quinone oxidoreductase subunit E